MNGRPADVALPAGRIGLGDGRHEYTDLGLVTLVFGPGLILPALARVTL